MKIEILGPLALCSVIAFSSLAGADQKNVREALIASANTSQVYAIDDYHTLVIPKYSILTGGNISAEFTTDFRALCSTSLDIIETESIENPDTGEVTKKTKISPFTTDEYNETVKDGVGCPDNFRVVKAFGRRLNDAFRTKSFIIKHTTPQKFAYKTEAIEGATSLPPDGQVKFIKEKSGTVAGLKGAFEGLFGEKKYRFDGEDLFQYLLDVSKKQNLKPRYIINSGKLKEVSVFDAIAYAFSGNIDIENKLWYFVAEGDKPFIVSFKQAKDGVPESSVALNKGVEGLKFTPLQKIAENKSPKAKPAP